MVSRDTLTCMWEPAAIDGIWLRPTSGTGPREPRWGHPDGIQIGLQPLPGPRGLIRVFTPYLDHPADRLLNFVAVEPIPLGASDRGFSELEPSRIDPGESGLRFWSIDNPSDAQPQPSQQPSRGLVDDDAETLTIHILAERFANGAHVWVTAEFRADSPHEVTFSTHAHADSVELESCVLTATMGNWARLRVLNLSRGTVTSAKLWPEYRDIHFADHASFGLDELVNDDGTVVFSAIPDEESPQTATYASDTAAHWHYQGDRATQGWRIADPHPAIRGQVNGRYTYWMSQAPIPGGVSFENLEIVEPFRDGARFTFFAEPLDTTTE